MPVRSMVNCDLDYIFCGEQYRTVLVKAEIKNSCISYKYECDFIWIFVDIIQTMRSNLWTFNIG